MICPEKGIPVLVKERNTLILGVFFPNKIKGTGPPEQEQGRP